MAIARSRALRDWKEATDSTIIIATDKSCEFFHTFALREDVDPVCSWTLRRLQVQRDSRSNIMTHETTASSSSWRSLYLLFQVMVLSFSISHNRLIYLTSTAIYNYTNLEHRVNRTQVACGPTVTSESGEHDLSEEGIDKCDPARQSTRFRTRSYH